MNVGIIAEYNPFHNGHLIHIEKSKEITKSSHCIVVMSGNFVQRGEPAICDKYIRTKAALLNGADLVIELPAMFSSASADIFAFGAVDILNKTGIINSLCFGTEQGSLNTFEDAANILSNESTEFKDILSDECKKGISFPKARLNALSYVLKTDLSFLSSPNNILALEYLKSLKILKSNIKPFTIKRYKADFHSYEINDNIASATAIRKYLINKLYSQTEKCIPKNYYNILIDSINKFIPLINDFSSILHYILINSDINDISEILDITEGLENRILKYTDTFLITDLINKIKTKRYTYTKLQRALLHIILNIKKSDINYYKSNGGIPYIRVLGFKKESSHLLSELTKKASVPIITNLKDSSKVLNEAGYYMLQSEIKSNDIYYICSSFKIGEEFRRPIVLI